MDDSNKLKEISALHKDSSFWAAIAVNSAGLIGVSNIIAGSPTPDTALQTMLIPAWLFVFGGTVASLGSILHSRVQRRKANHFEAMEIFAQATSLISQADDISRKKAAAALPICIQVLGQKPVTNATLDENVSAFIKASESELLSMDRHSRISSMASVIGVLFFITSLLWITISSRNGARIYEHERPFTGICLTETARIGSSPLDAYFRTVQVTT